MQKNGEKEFGIEFDFNSWRSLSGEVRTVPIPPRDPGWVPCNIRSVTAVDLGSTAYPVLCQSKAASLEPFSLKGIRRG